MKNRRTLSWIRAAAFLAAALAAGLTVSRRDSRAAEISTPGLRIVFEDRFEADAKRAAAIAPSISREVSAALGVLGPALVIIELKGPGGFESATGRGAGEWAIAVAIPSESKIVVRAARLDIVNDLATTLKHEYVHLLIGLVESRAGASVPAWFHEGVAQVLCERVFLGTKQDFLTAAAAGRLIPLFSLESAWPSSEGDARLAYAQSADFVEFIERRRKGAPMAILGAFEKRRDFASAFAEAMGETMASAEAAWVASAPSGRNLVVAMLEDNPGLTWVVLFAAAAVLLVAGYARYARRKKDLFDSLDD